MEVEFTQKPAELNEGVFNTALDLAMSFNHNVVQLTNSTHILDTCTS